MRSTNCHFSTSPGRISLTPRIALISIGVPFPGMLPSCPLLAEDCSRAIVGLSKERTAGKECATISRASTAACGEWKPEEKGGGMGKYAIAVIPGDGVGKEVVDEGIRVMEALGIQVPNLAFAFVRFDWGSEYYFRNGRMMPEDALETLAAFDTIYLGAVGDPRLPDHVALQGLRLPMRRAFDQYVNVRPAMLYEGIESPLKGKKPGDIDMLVVRENTEGEYSDIGGLGYQGSDREVVMQGSMFTRWGTERIIRYAFDLARQRP